MDYKEKYEKALEWMKSIYPTMQGSDKEDAEHYFPELTESEDERIRKILIHIVKGACNKYGIKYIGDEITEEKLLSYLEKRKEPRDYHDLYKGISQSEWFKQNYEGKSLGEEENPKEWSEEDEKQIRQIERIVKDAGCTQKLQEQIHNWFKSLRPQSRWKPSEEQMEAFKSYIEDFQARAEAAVGGWDNFDVMIRLYEQLKAIKEDKK